MALPRRIETPRLRLEATIPEHADSIWKAKETSLDALRPWMDWAEGDPDSTVVFTQRAQQRWSAGLEWNFTTFENEEVVGTTGLFNYNPRYLKGEIGYWIRSDRTKQGYACEAASALVHFAFEDLGLQRVELHCGVDNQASMRVAEKLGFEREGRLRHASRSAGDWYDVFLYALLRRDPRPRFHLPS